MTPAGKRKLGLAAAILLLIVACMLFPRVLGFVELAARELRYLWWLVLILALGVWLAFFYRGRNR